MPMDENAKLWEVWKRHFLENQELNPIIPIIALTANAFDADRVSAMEAGCNAFSDKSL